MSDCDCGDDMFFTTGNGVRTCDAHKTVREDPEAGVMDWYQPDAAAFPDRWHRECDDGLEVRHSELKPCE